MKDYEILIWSALAALFCWCVLGLPFAVWTSPFGRKVEPVAGF